MIKRLKLKIIALTMSAVFVLLSVVVAGMNIINYSAVVSEADDTLSLLSKNKGRFPEMKGEAPFDRLPDHMSPEAPYESRYFSVLLSREGSIKHIETGKIASVDSSQAIEYAKRASAHDADSGFVDSFRYMCSNEAGETRIIFLDCGRKLDSFMTFFHASLGMALVGLIIVFFVVFVFAGKMIRPIYESNEKQKRFITDAGHEMKTPLTIINANVDLLEMDLENGNEYLEDIKHQTKRLSALTEDLVMLARIEETNNTRLMIDFPISEVVEDTAMQFRAPSLSQGKEFICNIEPTLTMNGDVRSVEKLVSILMDNALKYSPYGGVICLELRRHSKTLVLTVSNTTEREVTKESISHLFDRFYRADESRNSATGGYGIGLSVAKAIVTLHDGKIHASCPDERSFCITVTLPV